MQIEISGTHIEITDALRNYTTEKFDRLIRHYNRIINITVNLKVEKMEQIAHATIAVPGETLNADADSNDMYTAIDLLVDKLDRQLIKFKEKHEHAK